MQQTFYDNVEDAISGLLGEYRHNEQVVVFQAHDPFAPDVEWNEHRLPKGTIGLYYFRSGLTSGEMPWRVGDPPPEGPWCLCSVFNPTTLSLVSDTRLIAALGLFEELTERVGKLLAHAFSRNAVASSRIRSTLTMK